MQEPSEQGASYWVELLVIIVMSIATISFMGWVIYQAFMVWE